MTDTAALSRHITQIEARAQRMESPFSGYARHIIPPLKMMMDEA